MRTSRTPPEWTTYAKVLVAAITLYLVLLFYWAGIFSGQPLVNAMRRMPPSEFRTNSARITEQLSSLLQGNKRTKVDPAEKGGLYPPISVIWHLVDSAKLDQQELLEAAETSMNRLAQVAAEDYVYIELVVVVYDSKLEDHISQWVSRSSLQAKVRKVELIPRPATSGSLDAEFVQIIEPAMALISTNFTYFMSGLCEPRIECISRLLTEFKRDQAVGIAGSKVIRVRGAPIGFAEGEIVSAGVDASLAGADVEYYHRFKGAPSLYSPASVAAQVIAPSSISFMLSMEIWSNVVKAFEGGHLLRAPASLLDLCLFSAFELHQRVVYVPESVVEFNLVGVSLSTKLSTPASMLSLMPIRVSALDAKQPLHQEVLRQYVFKRMDIPPDITVTITSSEGRCSAATNELTALAIGLEARVNVRITRETPWCPGEPAWIEEALGRMHSKPPLNGPNGIQSSFIIESPVLNQQPTLKTQYYIGRRTTDTPYERCPFCVARMSEVWYFADYHRRDLENDKRLSLSGSNTQLVFLPPALNTWFWDPALYVRFTDVEAPSKGSATSEDERPFSFLSVFQWHDRKNWRGLLEAYFREFTENDRVELRIVTHHPEVSWFEDDKQYEAITSTVQAYIRELRLLTGLPRYYVDTTVYRTVELGALYKSADVFIHTSFSEAWGQTVLEAMSMGLPVIAGNHSGLERYLSPANSYPVTEKMNITELRSAMRSAFTFPSEAKKKGKQARDDVSRMFSQEVVSDLAIQRLRQVLERHQSVMAESQQAWAAKTGLAQLVKQRGD